ncbi:MAG: hypothetical protein GXP30_11335 [Verrucomicrobia bacterium]|nr:hypothetical protein [Verrucomicrobiota bacterium]
MITDKRPIAFLLYLVSGLLLILPELASAQNSIYRHTYPKNGDTRISLSSPFSKGPTHGFQTIRVVINNDTARDRLWKLNFEVSGSLAYSSTFQVPVEAGKEVDREILVPVPWNFKHSTYRQQNIRIQASGLPSLNTYHSEQFEAGWPNIIISEKLAAKNQTLLSNYLKDKRSKGTTTSSTSMATSTSSAPPFASSFDIKLLPDDWRAFIGYDAIMIASDEWLQLRPAVQKAILEWNRFGGILQIYTTSSNRASQFGSLGFDRLPFLGNVSRAQHSYGSIELHGWNGKDVKLEQTHNTLKKAALRRTDFAEAYTDHWELQNTFGMKSFNPLLVMLILTIFSVVVGPVNLFSLAKPGRRQRLFITTPIISLTASFLVMGIILFKDGLGGDGRRMLVMNLESAPDEKRAYITQEQISRTGVLLGNNFQLSDSSSISQVQLADSQWSHKINFSNTAQFSFTANQFAGDWFRSRTEQGQVIQTVQPTRSRIELTSPAKTDQAPILFSSLEFTVEELYYVGEGGRVWKSKTSPISPGSEIILEPSSRSALGKWWIPLTDALSSGYDTKDGDHSFRRRTRDISHQPGHFFAVSHDPKTGFIETLDSVKWANASALIFGPVVDRPSSTKPAADENPAK